MRGASMTELKLPIELVPSTSWFTNLRSLMTSAQWDHIRRDCYNEAGYRCEVCGGKGRKHPVECHEIWEYNDEYGLQTLIGTVALCPPCHKVKHMGLQLSRGTEAFMRSLNHFKVVNDITVEMAELEVMKAFAVHHQRSQIDWEVNVDWIVMEYPEYFRGDKLKTA